MGLTGGRSPTGDPTQGDKLLYGIAYAIIYGLLAVATPPFLDGDSAIPRLHGSQHVKAHVRPLVVVEVNGLRHGLANLVDAVERHPLEQLVLYGAVYSLCLGVVFRVAALCHAYQHTAVSENAGVFAAGVLATPVGVVYEALQHTPVGHDELQGHQQGLYGVSGLQRLAHAPADYI